MNYSRNPELIDRLAAEYALGTLRGAARRRFETILATDANARRALAAWQARLEPLTEAVAEVEPPARVWREVRRRTTGEGKTAGAEEARSSFWDSLAFWRGWGLVAGGFACALFAVMVLRGPEIVEVERVVEVPSKKRQQAYVATLRDAAGNVVAIAYAARDSDELWVKLTGAQPAAEGQALELWGLPAAEGSAPRSLGLLPATPAGTIKLAALADKTFSDVPNLAISLEPAGGSKTGAPTGPVLYSGPCFKFW